MTDEGRRTVAERHKRVLEQLRQQNTVLRARVLRQIAADQAFEELLRLAPDEASGPYRGELSPLVYRLAVRRAAAIHIARERALRLLVPALFAAFARAAVRVGEGRAT